MAMTLLDYLWLQKIYYRFYKHTKELTRLYSIFVVTLSIFNYIMASDKAKTTSAYVDVILTVTAEIRVKIET